MDLKEKLKDYQDLINSELEKLIDTERLPESQLNESAKYSLLAGGKRLRPILMLEAYKIFKSNINECMTFATSMEMVHNFSLIHDDLPGIDNDDFRHGKPTNHKRYDEATAILAGDLLLNKAYDNIAKYMMEDTDADIKLKSRAFKRFSHSVERMIIGEYVDTECEGKEISAEYLEYIYMNKTAALIKGSCRVGAILAGASEEDIEKISKYAYNIGIAFQIKDDILDVIGDEKEFGKPIGSDKANKKVTYVSKFGIEEAEREVENLTNEAIAIMESYGEKGEFLKELAIYMMSRTK